MGNIFTLCRAKEKIVFNDSLCEPLTPFAAERLDKCEYNIITIEENCQANFKLLSKDIHQLYTIIHDRLEHQSKMP